MVYRALGMRQGKKNRMEGGGRVRRCSQIAIGDNNAFTQGCWLWPEDTDFAGIRIRIGNSNYFNRNVMIDACGSDRDRRPQYVRPRCVHHRQQSSIR